MAVYVQPYNPWKEQAALSLLGGFIDKWQQSEQNRKTNAFRGQLQQDIANLTSGDNGISLMPQSEPQGYNSNPWANAFHKTDSPLTQFNIGTAQSQRRLPTMDEIARAGAALGASKRFSGLNPDTVQKIIGEMSQNAELQRMNDLRSQYAQQFGASSDFRDQIKAITGLAMEGGMPYQAIGEYSKVKPYPMSAGSVDTGSNIVPYVFNPENGSLQFSNPLTKGISPDTAAEAQSKIDVAKIAAGPQYASAQALNRKNELDALDSVLKAKQAELERHQLALENITDKNVAEAYRNTYIAPLENEIKQIHNRILAGIGSLGADSTQANLTAGGNSQTTTTGGKVNSNNVWFAMVGSPKGAFIGSPFGQVRTNPDTGKTYHHGGIDIPMTKGTPITVRPELGSVLTVQQSYLSKSFGNTVVLKSDRTVGGKPVRFRIAHMQDGSTSHLKPGNTINAGDIIGRVGNTGRAYGKNGGYHMHIEVYIGDEMKKVDPSTFFENNPWDNQSTQATQVIPMGKDNSPQTSKPSSADIPSSLDEQYSSDDWGTDIPILKKDDGATISQGELRAAAVSGGVTYEEAYQAALEKGYKPNQDLNLSFNYQKGSTTTPPASITPMQNNSNDVVPPNGEISQSNPFSVATQNEINNGTRNSVFAGAMNTSDAPTFQKTAPPDINTFAHYSAMFNGGNIPRLQNDIEAATRYFFSPERVTQSTQTAPAFPDNYLDRNKRNSPFAYSGSPVPQLNPWNIADFIEYLRPFFNSSITPYPDSIDMPPSTFTPYNIRGQYSFSPDDMPVMRTNSPNPWNISDFINYMRPFFNSYYETGGLNNGGVIPRILWGNFLNRMNNTF